MRYMCLINGPEVPMSEVPPSLMQAMDELTRAAIERGEFITAGGLEPSRNATHVSVRRGKVVVTDGPFAETKEVLGGFAIFNYPSREYAIEQAKVFMQLHAQHWPGWEGTCEVRPMLGMGAEPRHED